MKTFRKIYHEKKSHEEFELKNYMKLMKLEKARMKFSIETHMVKHFKFNYMSDKGNENSNWACDFCKKYKNKYSPDSIEHAVLCDNYAKLRQKYDLNSDNGTTDYFIKIVELRNNLLSVS